MNLRNVQSIVLILGAAALMTAPAGCNHSDDPDTSDLDGYFESHPYVEDPRTGSDQIVSVDPASASVNSIGGRAVFKVSGGTSPYRWDVSKTSVGSIATTDADGAEAVYTALSVGGNEIIVYDVDGHAAIATISGTAAAAPTITASPSSTLSADYDQTVLTVSGGTAPYTWDSIDHMKGYYPNGNTGASVVYTRYSAGDNAVTVTDGAGNKASLVISQPPP